MSLAAAHGSDGVRGYPATRYVFVARADSGIRLPLFAGGTLRGAFGGALRKLTCITRMPNCDGCSVRPHCPYTRIFDPIGSATQKGSGFRSLPRPYVVEPPEGGVVIGPGAHFSFGMVLVGRVRDDLPLVVAAWQRALRGGLGVPFGPTAQRGRAELERVVMETGPHGDQTVFEEGGAGVRPLSHDLPLPVAAGIDRVLVRFITPMRHQVNGRHTHTDALRPAQFLMDAVRRTVLLRQLYAGDGAFEASRLAELARQVKEFRRPERHDAFRRRLLRPRVVPGDPSSQGKVELREVPMGGVVGEWELAGPLDAFLPHLHAAQLTHVGHLASHGMGRLLLDLPRSGAKPLPG